MYKLERGTALQAKSTFFRAEPASCPHIVVRMQSLKPRSSRAGCAGSSTARRQIGRRCLVVRATAKPATEELVEIDPITGQPISTAALTSPVAGNRIQAGRFTWAYREATPDPAQASPDKPDVLLLHGLASSSYCYRNTLGLLGGSGYRALAPDWLGHGDSDKPPAAAFGYREEDFVGALEEWVAAVGVRRPFALVVQGFVLGQYGLSYALQHPDHISRLLVLNTPLALSSRLRPELAAYKAPLPFMRPSPNKPFDFMTYNMSGSPYAMAEKDALAYGRSAGDPAASAAVAKTMEELDWAGLLRRQDEGFRGWRKPSVCLFGSSDPFLQLGGLEEWLDSKRTNMRAVTLAAQLGHMPQEDYPQALHEALLQWLRGDTDAGDFKQGSLRMTRYGLVEGGKKK